MAKHGSNDTIPRAKPQASSERSQHGARALRRPAWPKTTKAVQSGHPRGYRGNYYQSLRNGEEHAYQEIDQ
jgi:hypothetical protein